ncbi:MAG: M16 family metallopeptidase [Terriglobia bacterium]
MPYTRIDAFKLENGLKVLMAPGGASPVANLEVWYHVGSKDERSGMTGFAHLFEHLMFDGTRNIPAGEFSNYIVRSGGIDNAYTTEDATVFWETMPSAELPVALWLEADRMRNLQITQSTFRKERDVVEEERRQRFDNQPYGGVVEALYAHAFTRSPYHHMPIGSMQDLDRASLDRVKSFYDAYYVPGNATLVITGQFDEGEARKDIEEYFGALPAGTDAIARDYAQEPVQGAERVAKLATDAALPAFVEGFHMPADGTPDSYPLRLAAKILADGESSWIYQRLVYRDQMAMQVDSEGDFSELPNLFFVFAVMNPGRTSPEGEAQVTQVLSKLKSGETTAEDLDRAKNEVLRDAALTRQSAQGRADALGYDAVILKDPDLYNTEMARVMRVTAADIQRAAQKYFTRRNLTLVEVYPRSQ